ncbi:MAG: amylo-alpha-1,6-glucosidase [bacterium]|nr:amylo-alpha-1,6-glucosidase [bacterium]
MKIIFGREELLNLEYSLKKEYLLTNGKGGYCSSTILDCHTRKYHGLLVLPFRKQGLFNLLSKLEVSVVFDHKDHLLSTNKFPNIFHPIGHQYIDSFEIEGYPTTNYLIGGVKIKKSLLMPKGGDSILIKYELAFGSKAVTLKASPFLAYRDIHSLTRENIDLRPRTYLEKNGTKIDPYKGLPPLYIQTSVKSIFYPAPHWWKNLEYLKERNRGYDYQEDLFTPGVFEVKLKEGKPVIFRAGISPAPGKIEREAEEELKRIDQEAERFAKEKEPLKTLKMSAGHYLIEDEKQERDIIAGYHWFKHWGRDTMISLTGITLARGEKEAALAILKRYANFEKDGLMPNFLGNNGTKAYNSVDTSLLYLWAIQNYILYTKDKKTVQEELIPKALRIITSFLEGRVPIAKIGEDGFLYAGRRDLPVTWMDAIVGGLGVTPRDGAAIDINSLWYNGLSLLANDFKEDLDKRLLLQIEGAIKLFEENFERLFWNEEKQSLIDVYRPDGNIDSAIRPNQLFAIGLPYTCISKDKAERVINTVKSHLATPYGLRTLSPQNPAYFENYAGSSEMRDRAYHQGTVWPWLIGIFADALLKVQGKKETKEYIQETFGELWGRHLQRYGLLHISEIFNPSPPYTAKGCMAQAWSIAEVIRTLDKL